MRWQEVAGGFTIPVSNEEEELLEQIREKGSVPKKQLDDRQRELARQMVNKGNLIRTERDGEIAFKPNDLQKIWRTQ
jgi:hypothetical protein